MFFRMAVERRRRQKAITTLLLDQKLLENYRSLVYFFRTKNANGMNQKKRYAIAKQQTASVNELKMEGLVDLINFRDPDGARSFRKIQPSKRGRQVLDTGDWLFHDEIWNEEI